MNRINILIIQLSKIKFMVYFPFGPLHFVRTEGGEIMETLVIDTHLFLNMVLDHLFPSLETQSFLERTHTSLAQSVAEFYTILIEEHL
jgi:hypothetical protein